MLLIILFFNVKGYSYILSNNCRELDINLEVWILIWGHTIKQTIYA